MNYYVISLINGLDIQELPAIESRQDAQEMAKRLETFFRKQGLAVEVVLHWIEEIFDPEFSEDTYKDRYSKLIGF